jgi:hypothetical protein
MPETSGNIDVPVEVRKPDGSTAQIGAARIFVWGPDMKNRMAELLGCTWDELPTRPEEVPQAVACQLRREGFPI